MADPFTVLSRLLFDQALRLDPGRGEPRDPDWPPGTRLEAQVRAVAADSSRALLQIGDQLVDARLPTPPQVGERLTLRVVEPYPKLVFALEDGQEGTSAREDAHVALSTTGRLLGDVLAQRRPGAADPPLRLAQTQALPTPLPGQPHAEDLATHLRQSLEKSGLFYEKHQARWVAGEYPLVELRQEPQARLHTPHAPPPPQIPQAVADAPLVGAEALPAVVSDQGEGAGQRAFAASSSQITEGPLRGQIELLDGRALTVTLPAWDGREIHWQLPERDGQAESADGPVWSTHLAVELPNLGGVRAHLKLSAQGLALTVSTTSEDSRQRLAQAQAALQQSLRDAGLVLTQLSLGVGHG